MSWSVPPRGPAPPSSSSEEELVIPAPAPAPKPTRAPRNSNRTEASSSYQGTRADLRVNSEGLPFEGKVILVTGAASGIGFEIAKYLAHRGAKVSMLDKLDRVGEACDFISDTMPRTCCRGRVPAKVMAYGADLKEEDIVRDWLEATKQDFGKIDGLVNNAGICVPNTIRQSTRDLFNETMTENVLGALKLTRKVRRILNDGASIVNISSMLGEHSFDGMANYTIASHALIGMTRATARDNDFHKRGIRVNAVCPGVIKTNMLEGMKAGMKRISGKSYKWDEDNVPVLFERYGEAREVAPLVAFLLGDGSKYTTGAVIPCDGFWMAN